MTSQPSFWILFSAAALAILAPAGCARPVPTALVTAPPARTGLGPDAFQALAERWYWLPPSERWDMCHDGLQYKDEIERFYAREQAVTGVEVLSVRLMESDTAAVVEVVTHKGPLTRTAWLYVSKREGPGWFVEWEKTRELAEGEP
jgi:hypothetical protein